VRIAPDTDAANWIEPRLHGFALDVGSFVPDGFQAYARIHHRPLRRLADGRLVPVSWKSIADANGRTVDEELLASGLSGNPSHVSSSGEVLWNEVSHFGSLSLQDTALLIETLRTQTKTPDRCWFGVWEGWANLWPYWRNAPTFSVPARELHLLEGTIADAFLSLGTTPWEHLSANLWWPDDNAWCVSSEIDFKWTYVGGSKDCVDKILSEPLLEAYRVVATTLR
jgi:hypothetical protein